MYIRILLLCTSNRIDIYIVYRTPKRVIDDGQHRKKAADDDGLASGDDTGVVPHRSVLFFPRIKFDDK